MPPARIFLDTYSPPLVILTAAASVVSDVGLSVFENVATPEADNVVTPETALLLIIIPLIVSTFVAAIILPPARIAPDTYRPPLEILTAAALDVAGFVVSENVATPLLLTVKTLVEVVLTSNKLAF